MSFVPTKDPVAGDAQSCDAIETVIVPRAIDLGGFEIRRALPHVERRMVGPFIFFDHIGPAVFRSGQGVDVRPHPHIGLATVTFLFEGEITHRDNLGYNAAIRPGAVNWMTAGRGIVHSERTAPELRLGGEHLHGLQCWVALPLVDEEMAPSFEHYDDHALPGGERRGQARPRHHRQGLRRELAGEDALGHHLRRGDARARRQDAARRRLRGARRLHRRRRDRRRRRPLRERSACSCSARTTASR